MIIQIEVPEDYPPLTRYIVKHVLDGLALGCRPYFVGPNALPPLYDTSARYILEPSYGSGVQKFRLPPDVLARGGADCGSLSVYEVARRQAMGQKCEISIADYTGDNAMHSQIRDPSLRGPTDIDDPSIRLGAQADWPQTFLYDLGKR